MHKRGQAAMEFLMTYGWALLVVLIAIGALAFFGVLNPSRLLPESCALGPGLACDDFKVTKDGFIHLSVINGMGKNLDLFTIHVDKKADESNEICGGFVGAIALPNALGMEEFPDGTTKQVVYAFKSSGYSPGFGINCDNDNSGDAKYNCCKFIGLALSPPIPLCSSTIDCGVSSPVPDKVGSRFKEDIIINYREKDSKAILHQRVGHLSARVEE